MNAGRDSPSEHQPYGDDLAAYALGALPDDEAAPIADHLRECDACRKHLRWLQPAVDLLPRSVEQVEPPSRLRRRLIATVRAEARQARAATPDTAPRRWRDWRGSLWRPATAAAAGALAVAAATGGYLLHEPGESSSVIAAHPSPSAPSALSASLERQGGQGILRMTSLPALPRRDVYEVWVRRKGALQPASLFVPRRDRTAEAAVPGPLDDADEVLVTREPRGGSPQPTSPPLLRASLH